MLAPISEPEPPAKARMTYPSESCSSTKDVPALPLWESVTIYFYKVQGGTSLVDVPCMPNMHSYINAQGVYFDPKAHDSL